MTRVKTENVLENLQKMPRDRGWAWVVLIVAWFNNIMVSGIYKSFGILFIEIQARFGSTSAQTSLIYSLLNASFSFTCLLIAIVDLKTVSVRQCISVGTALSCIGYLVAAFVPNVDLLIVFLGVGLGTGQGFIFTPQMTLIGQYFDKRKGLANCVALSGGSAGSLILPYIIGFFVDHYGFSGTMMLLAAINLNGLVFAALMRPFPMDEYNNLKAMAELRTEIDYVDEAPTQFKKSDDISKDGEEQQTIADDRTKQRSEILNDYDDKFKEIPELLNGSVVKTEDCTKQIKADDDMNQKVFSDVPKSILEHKTETDATLNLKSEQIDRFFDKLPTETNDETASMLNTTNNQSHSLESNGYKHHINGKLIKPELKPETAFLHSPYLQRSIGAIGRSSLYASSEFMVPSMEDISVYERHPETAVGKDALRTKPTSTYAKVKSKLGSLLDVRVFKIPVFLYYFPFAVLIANGASMYLSFMLPHAKDVGLSGPQIKSLMAINGVIDVIAIPFWGLLADKRYFKSSKLVVIATTCIGVPAMFVSYYDTYGTIVMFSTIYGIAGRVYFSLSPVILVEFLGLEYLRSSVGITLVIQAVFHSIMLPIVGLMRDEYGTYVASYQMMGVFLLVGAAGVLVMPELAIRIHGQRPQKQHEEVIE